jgi:hypothetical protein
MLEEDTKEMYLVNVKLVTGEDIIGVTYDMELQDGLLCLEDPMRIQIYDKSKDVDNIETGIIMIPYMPCSENGQYMTIKEKHIVIMNYASNEAIEYYSQVLNNKNKIELGTMH